MVINVFVPVSLMLEHANACACICKYLDTCIYRFGNDSERFMAKPQQKYALWGVDLIYYVHGNTPTVHNHMKYINESIAI